MNGLFDFFARLVRGVLKLVLGVAALVFDAIDHQTFRYAASRATT